MAVTPDSGPLRSLGAMLHWRRIATTLAFAFAGALVLAPGWTPDARSLFVRAAELGLLAMIVYGALERWPPRLPARVARWVVQVAGVAACIPLGAWALYVLSTPAGSPPFWEVPDRMEGFTNLSALGVLLAPWVALGAQVRKQEALTRHQALSFALERSELERKALDARLHLLQAQVTPHFLFNTLANVQALVEAGSPRAPEVLRSLIAYLRAAVPRLEETTTTLGDELQLVRAYLELMHLRMPDRLRFTIDVDPDCLDLHCPPMTLLTLVENAVRHGIDPSEEGGVIEVGLRREGDRCRIRVRDTGVGLRSGAPGLGTGLSGLRERLQLVFGGEARLDLFAPEPHGACAELEFPARVEARA